MKNKIKTKLKIKKLKENCCNLNKNNKKELIKTGCSTGLVVACCFGAFGFILTSLGFIGAALIFNKFADYILLPLFGFFGWTLFFQIKNLKSETTKYLGFLILGIITIYFSLRLSSFLLIIAGILLNYVYAKINVFNRKN